MKILYKNVSKTKIKKRLKWLIFALELYKNYSFSFALGVSFFLHVQNMLNNRNTIKRIIDSLIECINTEKVFL